MNQSKMSGNSSPSQRIKRSHLEMKINNENTDPTPHICQCGEFTKYVVEIKNQMKILVEAFGELKAILTRLLRQHNEDLEVHKKFPVLSMEQLIEMDKEITSENRTAYIKAMRSVIQPAGIAKNFKYILSTKVTMAYNIDGVQGKKCLKQLLNFYGALLEAIPITGKHTGTAEEQLRKAIQLQKRRQIKAKSVSKQIDNNKVPDNI